MEKQEKELTDMEIILKAVLGRKPKRVIVIMVLNDGTTAIGEEIPHAIQGKD